MPTNNALKPVRCGCGGEASCYFTHYWGKCFTVQCSECGIETKPYDTEAEAIEAWNRAMSSAEPERKKGKWIPHPHGREWDVCSVCGTGCKRREFEMYFGQEMFTEYGYQYCPHCGAEMRGDR